jgi:hypothetical protein
MINRKIDMLSIPKKAVAKIGIILLSPYDHFDTSAFK